MFERFKSRLVLKAVEEAEDRMRYMYHRKQEQERKEREKALDVHEKTALGNIFIDVWRRRHTEASDKDMVRLYIRLYPLSAEEIAVAIADQLSDDPDVPDFPLL